MGPTLRPQAAPTRKPRRGDRLELAVERIDPRGTAHGHLRDSSGEYDVRLPRGVPGSRLVAQVTRRRGARIDTRVLELLEAGPETVPVRCAHAATCGGCRFQDWSYAAQLEHKRQVVEETLRAGGVLDSARVEPCLGCDPPWAYRNKMDFTFSARRWIEPAEPVGAPRGFALGLHPSGHWRSVIDVHACAIAPPGTDAIVASARRLALEQGLEPWDVATHRGLLRHLVVRRNARGEVLVAVVTSEEASERIRPYVRALLAERPEIATAVQLVSSSLAQVATGERELVLHGPGWILEELDGLTFRLSAGSFFQTNTAQAERLVRAVREAAACGPEDVVVDLSCGVGTFALSLARGAREVWGFELAPSAVTDARLNAQRNAIGNAHFLAGDVAATLRERDLPRPAVCVVDPPRAGLHKSVLAALAALAPDRVVYVSCNVSAAAQDLRALSAAGLRLVRVQPIDLFPHTPHVECVLVLERSGEVRARAAEPERER
ncbi:MAG TPA: 23S rRNA (uracil(1939)-C(5))-methyltransferase RlmD [Planctomycetota bacterium]|nr:23S rRNA (uracil(1939)-C(5))-methyltransferase RlmD [Planctomycetota bacterium]